MNSGSIVSAVFGTILKIFATVAVIFLVYRGAVACYDYGYRIFAEPAISEGEGRVVTVAVAKELSPTQIGELFKEKGLVRDAKLFALQYMLSEYRKDVKPGVFELSTSMTAEEMMAVMAAEPSAGTTKEPSVETSAEPSTETENEE